MSDIISECIHQMRIPDIDNIRNTISYVYNWLYELKPNSKNFLNLTKEETVVIYNIISQDLYKTVFSFSTYAIDRQAVVLFFLKNIYKTSNVCMKKIYTLRSYEEYDNDYFHNLLLFDKNF